MAQTQETLTGLQFKIQQADGTVPEQLIIDSDRVLIGSGAHCEVRLPGDQAAAEHVLVTFNGGAVYAQARALNPPPLLNGTPFTEAPLTPGAILSVGRAEITISVVEIAENQGNLQKKKGQSSPLIYVLAAIAVPISLFVLLDDTGQDPTGGMPKQVPALWDGSAASCPQKAADQALSVAREKKAQAEGKRERSPFASVDGVQAVPLFETAAACFTVGGDASHAREMQGDADKLRKEVEEEYRAHQMRLEHSLDIKELKTAQREVKVLLAMLAGRTGDYVSWLSNLDRKLKLLVGQDRGKERKK